MPLHNVECQSQSVGYVVLKRPNEAKQPLSVNLFSHCIYVLATYPLNGYLQLWQFPYITVRCNFFGGLQE